MSCGHMVAPEGIDPMRSEAGAPAQARCPACNAQGLADLRHTPTVEGLCELEEDEAETRVSGWGRAARALTLAVMVISFGAWAYWSAGIEERTVRQFAFGLVPIAMLGLPMVFPFLRGLFSSQETGLPRRWRLVGRGRRRSRRVIRGRAEPTGESTEASALMSAPLSGRPCLAYELAVRSDPSPDTSFSSWRLVEQDNVDFRVGELEVARGRALLRLPRERASEGLLMSLDPKLRRSMRMRGFVDSEQVYVYETILAPGDGCTVDRGQAGSATQIFA